MNFHQSSVEVYFEDKATSCQSAFKICEGRLILDDDWPSFAPTAGVAANHRSLCQDWRCLSPKMTTERLSLFYSLFIFLLHLLLFFLLLYYLFVLLLFFNAVVSILFCISSLLCSFFFGSFRNVFILFILPCIHFFFCIYLFILYIAVLYVYMS